jgi:hypothetical protein
MARTRPAVRVPEYLALYVAQHSPKYLDMITKLIDRVGPRHRVPLLSQHITAAYFSQAITVACIVLAFSTIPPTTPASFDPFPLGP